MGVLIETMRREGFELSVSPPVVLFQEDEVRQHFPAWFEPVLEIAHA